MIYHETKNEAGPHRTPGTAGRKARPPRPTWYLSRPQRGEPDRHPIYPAEVWGSTGMILRGYRYEDGHHRL